VWGDLWKLEHSTKSTWPWTSQGEASMDNNYNRSGNDACPPCWLIVHRVLGVVQPSGPGEAAGIGYIELCRLLYTSGISKAYWLTTAIRRPIPARPSVDAAACGRWCHAYQLSLK